MYMVEELAQLLELVQQLDLESDFLFLVTVICMFQSICKNKLSHDRTGLLLSAITGRGNCLNQEHFRSATIILINTPKKDHTTKILSQSGNKEKTIFCFIAINIITEEIKSKQLTGTKLPMFLLRQSELFSFFGISQN